MLNALCKIWILASISVAAMQPLLSAQSREPSHAPGCEESHRVITPRNPRVGTDGNILAGQAIVQMRLALDENTRVRVVEYPRSSKVLDSYNSTIVIQRGQERTEYSVGRLIKHGSNLRLVEVASLCTSSFDQGKIFLAFGTPNVGAAEGFAVILYSPEAVDFQAFPVASQGRIVVNKAEPDKVELWSATGPARPLEDCDACKKHYVVLDCRVGKQSVECKRRPGAGKVVAPDAFERARIEVR